MKMLPETIKYRAALIKRVFAEQEKRGHADADLAGKVGASPKTVSGWRRGHTPSKEQVIERLEAYSKGARLKNGTTKSKRRNSKAPRSMPPLELVRFAIEQGYHIKIEVESDNFTAVWES